MSNRCLRCGGEARHAVTVYNRSARDYVDVSMCGSCYDSYTPSVNGKGELVWKRYRNVKTYVVFTLLGSRSAALWFSRVLDRLVETLPARAFIRMSEYVAVALSALSVALLAYSTFWYATNIGTEPLRKLQNIYTSNRLAGIGVPGLDPLLPLFEAALALAVGVTIHELAHALVLRRYGIDVRMVGIALVGPLPVAAFVEPPGAVEARMDGRRLLQLSGSGVTANVLVALTGLAAFTAILAGLTPLTGEAEAALAKLVAYPQLLLTPPHVLSALGLETPMTRPDWWTHAVLGGSYALPLSIAYYMFLVNILLAIFNSLPVKTFDGGHIMRALLLRRLGPVRTFAAMNYTTIAVVSLIAFVALVTRI